MTNKINKEDYIVTRLNLNSHYWLFIYFKGEKVYSDHWRPQKNYSKRIFNQYIRSLEKPIPQKELYPAKEVIVAHPKDTYETVKKEIGRVVHARAKDVTKGYVWVMKVRIGHYETYKDKYNETKFYDHEYFEIAGENVEELIACFDQRLNKYHADNLLIDQDIVEFLELTQKPIEDVFYQYTDAVKDHKVGTYAEVKAESDFRDPDFKDELNRDIAKGKYRKKVRSKKQKIGKKKTNNWGNIAKGKIGIGLKNKK